MAIVSVLAGGNPEAGWNRVQALASCVPGTTGFVNLQPATWLASKLLRAPGRFADVGFWRQVVLDD